VGGDPTLGLRGITANITMANPIGSIALTVDDSADASPVVQNITLGATSMNFTGGLVIQTINYANLTSLTVNGGTGMNSFTVNSPPAPTTINGSTSIHQDFFVQATTQPLTINNQSTASTPDFVTVANNRLTGGITGVVTVTGKPGSINLAIDDGNDPAPTSPTISGSSVTAISPAPVDYVPLALNSLNVVGGLHGNTFAVTGTGAATILTTGPGSNTVSVKATTAPLIIDDNSNGPTPDIITLGNAGNTRGINGSVNIRGTGVLPQAVMDDSADSTNTTATLGIVDGFSVLSGLSGQPLVFPNSGVGLLTVHTGTGTNMLTVDFSIGNPLPLSSGLDYHGGTGSNKLNLQGGAFTNEDYSAIGPGAGSINLDGTSINP
jgi:hypothetical protein